MKAGRAQFINWEGTIINLGVKIKAFTIDSKNLGALAP